VGGFYLSTLNLIKHYLRDIELYKAKSINFEHIELKKVKSIDLKQIDLNKAKVIDLAAVMKLF
jgi:hypothetical protein